MPDDVLRDDQIFGPSSLGPPSDDDFWARYKMPARQTREQPPFRTGQVVRQLSGVGMRENQSRTVEALRYVSSRAFTGWAMRLRGCDRPYACDMFEVVGATPPVGTAVNDADGNFIGVTVDQSPGGQILRDAANSGVAADVVRVSIAAALQRPDSGTTLPTAAEVARIATGRDRGRTCIRDFSITPRISVEYYARYNAWQVVVNSNGACDNMQVPCDAVYGRSTIHDIAAVLQQRAGGLLSLSDAFTLAAMLLESPEGRRAPAASELPPPPAGQASLFQTSQPAVEPVPLENRPRRRIIRRGAK
jgi:hypothetical protein